SGRLLHDLLAGSAQAHPDRTAVSDRGSHLTYADLDARAGSLAGLLRELGVAEGDRVGIYLDKQADALTGIYGVLKGGAVYVPLAPRTPPARLGHMTRDCGIRVLVTAGEQARKGEELRREGVPLEAMVVLRNDPSAATLAAPDGVTLATATDVDAQAPI